MGKYLIMARIGEREWQAVNIYEGDYAGAKKVGKYIANVDKNTDIIVVRLVIGWYR